MGRDGASSHAFRAQDHGPATSMRLAWLPSWGELLVEAGFEVVARYGWFDRRPDEGGEDTIWIARRPR